MVWKITLALHLSVDKGTKKILFYFILFDLIEHEKITDINSSKKTFQTNVKMFFIPRLL